MEKVNLYSCVSKPLNCANGVNSAKAVAPQSVGFTSSVASNPNTDSVSFRSQKDIYLEKLNQLFPNGELDRVYKDINKDFGIDVPPQLKFYGDNDGVAAGGFTFERNEIAMSLSDLLSSDTKIVGIKDGKRTVLVSPKVKLPLFVDNKSANEFIKLHSQHGNLGFDELVAEPLSEEEKKKLVIQKIAHEVIHAQQHMIMRQTEGIGEKEIIKAWTHQKPKNMIDRAILGFKVRDLYNKSVWGDMPETEKTIPNGSPKSVMAHIWLEAVRNYPPVNSPAYEKNPIEVDAYERSAQYLKQKYGWWN